MYGDGGKDKMESYNEMFGKVIKYIVNKNVLDIGCVYHTMDQEQTETWVHRFLLNNAKRVLGIDILREEIKELKKKGYNVRYGDAETFKLNKKFDVIFAGDVIEHLSNQGLFLERCKKHLKKDGILIVNTPNSFSLYTSFKNAFLLRSNPSSSQQHTCYYTPNTIKELFIRNGFRIVRFEFSDFYGTILGFIRFQIMCILGDKWKRKMIVIAKLSKIE